MALRNSSFKEFMVSSSDMIFFSANEQSIDSLFNSRGFILTSFCCDFFYCRILNIFLKCSFVLKFTFYFCLLSKNYSSFLCN